MTENYHPAEANGNPRHDQEASSHHAKDLKKKKRIKICFYVLLFIVFQTAVITLFALTILKFRTPKFRATSANFFSLGPQTASFNGTMNIDLGVKNTNFGHFRYRNSTIDIYHEDIIIGQGIVERGRAKWRSTRRFSVVVDLSVNNVASNSRLARALSDGVVPLRAESHIRGKVTIMMIMKRKKSANLNCTMNLLTRTSQVANIVCD